MDLLKFPATTPLVVRSAIVQPGTAITISGDLFEDGKRRIALDRNTTDEQLEHVTQALAELTLEYDRITGLVASVNELMAAAATRAQALAEGSAETLIERAAHPNGSES